MDVTFRLCRLARMSVLLICLSPGFAAADSASSPRYHEWVNEVFQSETVYPQEEGEVQVSVGALFERGDEDRRSVTPLALEYGITSAWQVELEWDSVVSLDPRDGDRVWGSGDLEIGTKYAWMNVGDSNLHLAAGFELGLPVGRFGNGISEGVAEYEPYLIVAHDFPSFFDLHVSNTLNR